MSVKCISNAFWNHEDYSRYVRRDQYHGIYFVHLNSPVLKLEKMEKYYTGQNKLKPKSI